MNNTVISLIRKPVLIFRRYLSFEKRCGAVLECRVFHIRIAFKCGVSEHYWILELASHWECVSNYSPLEHTKQHSDCLLFSPCDRHRCLDAFVSHLWLPIQGHDFSNVMDQAYELKPIWIQVKMREVLFKIPFAMLYFNIRPKNHLELSHLDMYFSPERSSACLDILIRNWTKTT